MPNKVLTLEQAIKEYVKPGMKLHLAGGIGGPGAAVCEIIRQFNNTNPDFEIIQSTVTGHSINLIHCNLVKKLIFSACIEISISGHPSRIIQNAYKEKSVELENWSLLSLQQRLMAGAFGFGFIPTGSISGSSLASDNHESFREIDNPFDSDKKAGVIKALNPDLSIIHGCMADESGNTILPAPYGDDIWGPLASSGGVLVTVEKIVPHDEIRKYSSMVKIPSFAVNAVCQVPMGMHPFTLFDPTGDSIEAYETDVDFLENLRKASTTSEKLDTWIREWITDCPDHETYLTKLGDNRISDLKTAARKQPFLQKSLSKSSSNEPIPDCSTNEMTIVAAAREIVASILESGHKTMLVGAGTWSLAARLAYYELIKMGYEIELIAGNGQIGYIPQPDESGTQTVAGTSSSSMLTDTITTHGVFVGGKNNRCLSVLGAGQIDKYGNINSSRTSTGDFLVGTGGANDAAMAKEVIVIINQSKERFSEKLPYITAIGDKVSKVISTMGVFEKKPGTDELVLTACFSASKDDSLEALIKEIKENCGWNLKRAKEVKLSEKPSNDDLQTLKLLIT